MRINNMPREFKHNDATEFKETIYLCAVKHDVRLSFFFHSTVHFEQIKLHNKI